MADRIPLPRELQHLIEKRDSDSGRREDRRKADEPIAIERRSGIDRRQRRRRGEDRTS
jgi:hypothetical protein